MSAEAKRSRVVVKAAIYAVASEVGMCVILFRHGHLDVMGGNLLDLVVYIFHAPGLAVTAGLSLKTPTHDFWIYLITVFSGGVQFFLLYWLLLDLWKRRHSSKGTLQGAEIDR